MLIGTLKRNKMDNNIAKQLQNPEFRFVLLRGKIPFEEEWQKHPYKYDDKKLINWIKEGNNHGIIGGYGRVRLLDIDDPKFVPEIEKVFKTFSVKTGRGGRHFYFLSDYDKNHVLAEGKGELRGNMQFVVCPNCIHPNGNKYEVIEDEDLLDITEEELVKILQPLFKDNPLVKCDIGKMLKGEATLGERNDGYFRSACLFRFQKISIDVARELLTTANEKNTKPISQKELDRVIKNAYSYKNKKEESKKEANEGIKKEKKEDLTILTRRGQIESFWNTQPFYYDKSKIFYLWNKELFKWEISDEIDFCNSIYSILGMDTINRRNKGEIVESFKQIGRMHKPKDMKKSWVQFKNRIYNIKTGEDFEATPEYFVTNPIPYKVGETEETPIIDGYFTDWMTGQDLSWKDTLYEIMAYNICRDKFMQRIIALCGGGANGKGTYAKLNYKFLGMDNCVASEIKNLSEDKFEPAVLYQKLLCIMGEVHYDDLKNTNQLKKLGGEDKMSFQFKGKTPFTEDNTATCICLTNSMPITPDKTIGFYRKWLIIDFPNQFKQVDKNLIDDIPEEEFENLAKKLLRVLKELYTNPHFTNEGDFNERAKRYEERSNPIMKFIEDECVEEAGEMICLRDFTNACNEYMKSKHLRIMNSNQVGKVLRDEGFVVGKRHIDEVSAVVIVNLSITNNTLTTQNSNSKLYRETSRDLSSLKGIKNIVIKETEPIFQTINQPCTVCGAKISHIYDEKTGDPLCETCYKSKEVQT